VTVGALVDLTGGNASSDKALQAGLEVALEDLDRYLSEQGADFRLKLSLIDGESDAGLALAKLQTLESQGIRVVIGPGSSESLARIKDYADQHGIVLISPSSTAPSLALEDNIVRTAPVDIVQARAIAMLLHDQGIQRVEPSRHSRRKSRRPSPRSEPAPWRWSCSRSTRPVISSWPRKTMPR